MKQLAIACGVAPPPVGPRGEMRRLDAQHGRLQRVHPEVARRPDGGSTSASCRACAAAARAPRAHRRSVVSRPASPKAPRFLLGKNEKQPNAPMRAEPDAICRSRRSPAPRLRSPECRRGWRRVMIGSMSAPRPNRCTGMIALVRGVIAAAACAGSMLNVAGSMSTSTGVAPTRTTAPAVAKNENVVVTTSSPALMPSAISASSSASVPDDTAIACLTPSSAASSRSRPSISGPMMKRWLSQTRVTAASSLIAQRPVLGVEIEEGYAASGYSTYRAISPPRAFRDRSRAA